MLVADYACTSQSTATASCGCIQPEDSLCQNKGHSRNADFSPSNQTDATLKFSTFKSQRNTRTAPKESKQKMGVITPLPTCLLPMRHTTNGAGRCLSPLTTTALNDRTIAISASASSCSLLQRLRRRRCLLHPN